MRSFAIACLLLCHAPCGLLAAEEYHVAPHGKDTNSGSSGSPFATLHRARDAVRALKTNSGLPSGGVTIWLAEGSYPLTNTLRLGAEDSGTAESPIVYRGRETSRVLFDGNRPIPTDPWQPAGDSTSARLNPKARGNVLQALIRDEQTIEVLANPGTRLTLAGRVMQLARFPNVGFCHVDEILDKGAVYMHGRTLGPRPTYSMDSPAGGTFTLVENPSGDWDAELKRVQKATVSGYLAFDWHRQRHRIASLKGKAIQLLEYSAYGIAKEGDIPRRLVVQNLLCELDQPGEWYFDDAEKKLFLWPFDNTDPSRDLGYWSGPPLVELEGTSHITIRNLTVQGVGGGTSLGIKGGQDNLIAGCTIRNSMHTGVHIREGERNGMVGCDLYDLGGHLSLEGGTHRTLTPAGNYARNNHFTQVGSRELYGGIRIRGVGQVFQNNLVHNFPGQPITVGGNDHLVERNEVFNVGIEEGDGGAIYGLAEMWSFGNVFRQNFIHHLMCVPQAHPRGGIYPDDLNAGDTITENIFYKAAHRAVLINGGAAHTVTHNIFIKGHYGVYNTEVWSKKIIESQAKYDSGELKRGDKDDHLWRIEHAVGREGWNRPPWNKYPLFAKVMNQVERRFYPIENTVSHNLFAGNHQNTAFRFGWGDQKLASMEEIDYIIMEDNRELALDRFQNPADLDFRFKPGAKPADFPDIPFDQIGLITDPFRPQIPDKAAYRRTVRQQWNHRKSYDEDAIYDPATINALLYFNTGRLIVGESTQ